MLMHEFIQPLHHAIASLPNRLLIAFIATQSKCEGRLDPRNPVHVRAPHGPKVSERVFLRSAETKSTVIGDGSASGRRCVSSLSNRRWTVFISSGFLADSPWRRRNPTSIDARRPLGHAARENQPGGRRQAVVYEGVLLSQVLKKAGVPSGGGMRGKALASYLLAEAPTITRSPSDFPSLIPESATRAC
jgi:hypothetical protein